MGHPSILSYPGGKTRAVKILLPIIADNSVMISPFFGGGSLEFSFANAGGTVHGCDIWKPVANFWQQVKINPQAVADEVRKYFPMPKDDFYMLRDRHMSLTDPIEMAGQFYALNRSSFSGLTLGGFSPGHIMFTTSSIDRLDAFVMDSVDVSNDDMFEWLPYIILKYARRKSDTVIYLDPPYLIKNPELYGNRGSTHKGFDHAGLANLLKILDKSGWKWLLSYNNIDEIKEMYSHYRQTEPRWTYYLGKDTASKELLIYSNAMEEVHEVFQMDMFP